MDEERHGSDVEKIASAFYDIRYIETLKGRMFISNKRDYHESFQRQPRAYVLLLYENDAF